MKPVAFAALALILLAGCGQAPASVKAPRKAAKAAASKSAASKAAAKGAAAVAEKGVLAMFRLAHGHLDADADGALDPKEFARIAKDEVLPGLPAFSAIDADDDGRITLAEFTHKSLLKGKAALFTERAQAEFADLDANADRRLTRQEMSGSEVAFAAADRNKDGKVTAGEFSGALADAMAAGG